MQRNRTFCAAILGKHPRFKVDRIKSFACEPGYKLIEIGRSLPQIAGGDLGFIIKQFERRNAAH